MANIKDVAEKAGVSISTVSHVINCTRFVAEETKDRVQQAIRELSYSPNAVANSLRTKKSKTIGLVIPIGQDENSNIFIMQVVLGIDSVFRKKGYSTILVNSKDNIRYEKDAVRDLLSRQIDGMIIAPAFGDHTEIKKLLTGREYVFVDRTPEGIAGEDIILSDAFTGSRDAVRDMVAAGHRKIGILCAPVGKYANSDVRLNGYHKVLEEAGITSNPEYIRECTADVEDGFRQTKWLMEHTDITALFAVSNIMGMGAVKYMQKSKQLIPDDLSITVFDDYDWSMIYNPPLTTVRQDAYGMGKKSAQVLLQRLENPAYPKREYFLPTRLIVRESLKVLI